MIVSDTADSEVTSTDFSRFLVTSTNLPSKLGSMEPRTNGEVSIDGHESGRQAIVWPVPQNREIGVDDFSRDPHAAKYQGELQAHPDAFDRLFELLNDPANEQRLVDAEMLGLPALTGVVRFIEADFVIAHALKADQGINRFRQTVGVAIRLKMGKLGWKKAGRKGTVRGSRCFTKAERYINETPAHICTALALEALEKVSQIGDEHERAQTGRELMEALANERRKEGRPF